MSVLRPKFVLLALLCALLQVFLAGGCTGGAFTAGEAQGGSSSRAGSGSGGTSVGASTGTKCSGPEDCNDNDACTVDLCKADGTCDTAPQCQGTDKCCGGDCKGCCKNEDCNDGVSCTQNTCFMGQCMFVPDDTGCQPSEYCAAGIGCRPRQPCGILTGEDVSQVCDDDSACTADTCGADKFCRHDYCKTQESVAKLCCEGIGCAEECCIDSQCNQLDDPCNVGACVMGKCTTKPLCADGSCCPSPDKKSASCGACCNATDCDDRVPCTQDDCAGGQCSHTPLACEPGFFCDLKNGCTKTDRCQTASDCKTTLCETATCTGGKCQIQTCSSGKCCVDPMGEPSGCALCCADNECSDHVDCTVDACGPKGCTHTPNNKLCPSGICDASAGCVQCQGAADCDDRLPCTKDTCEAGRCAHGNTCAIATPYCTADGCAQCRSVSDCTGGIASPQAAIGLGCQKAQCLMGKCSVTYSSCDIGFCCAPYGCMVQGCVGTQ